MTKKKKEITRTFREVKEEDGTERLEQTGTISPPGPKIISPDEGIVVPDPQPIPEQEPF